MIMPECWEAFLTSRTSAVCIGHVISCEGKKLRINITLIFLLFD